MAGLTTTFTQIG